MIQGFSSGLIGNRELIYETDLPSFQRDFASVKTLDHGTGPAITFTRASGATYFDVNGVLQTAANDVARFDHSSTGSSLGLLIEDSRTNQLQRSDNFADAYWSKTRSTIASTSQLSPNNVTTAERLVENTDSGTSHLLGRNVSGLAPTVTLTASVFAKADTRSRFQFVLRDVDATSNNVQAFFDLESGTIFSGPTSSGNGSEAAASITPVGNGWYRCSVSGIANTSGSNSAFVVFLHDGTSTNYTGNGTSGLFLWGAQLELGAFATSYIPTTTAAATRSADSAGVTPISSFYNQSEGTLFAEASSDRSTAASFPVVTQLAADDSNRIALSRSTSTSAGRLSVTVDSNTQVGTDIGSWPISSVAKVIAAYRQDDFAATVNGATVTTDTSGTVPIVSSLRIGSNAVATGQIGGHIRKIAYWPKRLTNTLLEQLTT